MPTSIDGTDGGRSQEPILVQKARPWHGARLRVVEMGVFFFHHDH